MYKALHDEVARELIVWGVVALCLFVVLLTACCCCSSCPLHKSMHREARGGTTPRRGMDDDSRYGESRYGDSYETHGYEMRDRPSRTPERPDRTSPTNAHHDNAPFALDSTAERSALV